MPVARIQIADLYQAIYDPVFSVVEGLTRQGVESTTARVVGEILQKATTTTAYQWNKSFHETIDRLRAHHNRELLNARRNDR